MSARRGTTRPAASSPLPEAERRRRTACPCPSSPNGGERRAVCRRSSAPSRQHQVSVPPLRPPPADHHQAQAPPSRSADTNSVSPSVYAAATGAPSPAIEAPCVLQRGAGPESLKKNALPRQNQFLEP